MNLVHKKKKVNKVDEITKDIESTLPFLKIHDNGIFELREHFYSKSYEIPDINYDTLDKQQQTEIGIQWAIFLSSFDSNISVQLSGYNQTIDKDAYEEKIMMRYQNDDLDYFREENSNVIMEQVQNAKSNLEDHLYISITAPAIDIMEAISKFEEIDKHVKNELSVILNENVTPMSTNERINLLHFIYNPEEIKPLVRTRMVDGKEVPTFSIEQCLAQGIIPETIIGPDSLSISRNSFQMGNKVGKSFYAALYPSNLRSDTISSFLSLPCNMLFSCHLRTYETGEGIDLVKEKNTNIDANLIEKQQHAWNKGYDPSLINPELSSTKIDTLEVLEELTDNDGRLFLAMMTITLFANDMKELKQLEEGLRMKASAKGFIFKSANVYQKNAFNSSIPIGKNEMPEMDRLLTTNSIIALSPFCTKRINDPEGYYLGNNGVSNEPVIYDRKKGMNSNMVILGASGAGKSFCAKEEITYPVLDKKDQVYVIDPQGEYTIIADTYHGTIINIGVGSSTHINPFDLDIDSGDDDTDPLKLKADFIETMIDMMIGSKWGLTPAQKSVISRVTNLIYTDYIQYCKDHNVSIDRAHCPTLIDFYNELLRQRDTSGRIDQNAVDIANGIEKFVTSQDVFAHHTNIDVENNFIVYRILSIGKGLKQLGLFIILDQIWNKIVANGRNNIWTWLYIDEFHTLLETAGEHVAEIWKKVRQWKGLCTAITQNVEDMLHNEYSRLIFDNSYVVKILTQLPAAQKMVQQVFNIPNEEMKFITSGKPGRGIIQIGEDLIPIDNEFPEDTKLYKVWSTKPKEEKIH